MGTVTDRLMRWWPALWLLALAWPLEMAFDRSPPFALGKYSEPTPVRPGEAVNFVIPATREIDRDCSVRYSRHIIDAAGVRHDYSGEQMMSSESLRQQAEIMGPFVRVSVTVPSGAKPGRAMLVTELRYECNPIHALWPIKLPLYFGFEVLPIEQRAP